MANNRAFPRHLGLLKHARAREIPISVEELVLFQKAGFLFTVKLAKDHCLIEWPEGEGMPEFAKFIWAMRNIDQQF